MAKLTISMPDAMSDYVSERVAGGDYSDAGEYFRDLVRRERESRRAITELGEMLDDAEASGVSERTAAEIWQDSINRRAARDG